MIYSKDYTVHPLLLYFGIKIKPELFYQILLVKMTIGILLTILLCWKKLVLCMVAMKKLALVFWLSQQWIFFTSFQTEIQRINDGSLCDYIFFWLLS